MLSFVILILIMFKYKAGQGPESNHSNLDDLEAGSPLRDEDGNMFEGSYPYVMNGNKKIIWPKPDETENYRVNDEVYVYSYAVGTMEEIYPDFMTNIMVVPRQDQAVHTTGLSTVAPTMPTVTLPTESAILPTTGSTIMPMSHLLPSSTVQLPPPTANLPPVKEQKNSKKNWAKRKILGPLKSLKKSFIMKRRGSRVLPEIGESALPSPV